MLFWKSMPISDTATVLSKLFVGLIAIPLVYFAAADLATLLMAFMISVRATSRRGLAARFWQPELWLQLQVLWLYVIVTSGDLVSCRSPAGSWWYRPGPSAR